MVAKTQLLEAEDYCVTESELEDGEAESEATPDGTTCEIEVSGEDGSVPRFEEDD